ncbi:hypothetical protein HME9302_00469 [Alteripontixanthobacter maritimus]|uniref:Lipoprotein n=1 Tax=Alteripontixanthobacter maritimus TaxID=2161824 RepID=A0A369Q452_9SPHN|nr:hypothetical protein [Alteripontixanthobacter maritimus]RDC59282.1 hypothetical protein HME9302_00469 [Alteripontixanthobacter maritimus]
MPKRTTLIAAATVAACLAATGLQAQSTSSETDPGAIAPGSFDRVQECRAIAEPDQRLACYDAAVGVMMQAEAAGDLRIVEADDLKETRRSLFGLSLPKIALFGNDGDDKDDDTTMLETTVTAVNASRRGPIVFRTAENAVWQISNPPSRLRGPKPGDTVVFKKASLGSYFIRVNGQIGVKGRRIE